MMPAAFDQQAPRPLAGITVIEFSHMVMGPSCGMILADLGADVIKIEPAPAGDNTRRLTGPAIGFFPTFNRNKRSLCVDLKQPDGLNLVKRLVAGADVLVENFRPGAMERMGIGAKQVVEVNPKLVYCSCKGFLPGPYQHRAALDEVVQMMGGLAYMTGPPGSPLRAGSSVNDIMGGVFAALAVLAALRQRDATGRGGIVQSGLFETNMVFMAQHMAQAAIEGRDPPPFGDPNMKKPWPLYDVFETADPGERVFVGVVTDTQWRSFCTAFGLRDLADDPALSSMAALAEARPHILKRVSDVFRALPKADLVRRCDELGLPFAPVAKPTDLFNDPHLLASGGLLETDLMRTDAATAAGLPALPILLSGRRPGLTRQPPHPGEHSAEIASEAGLSAGEITNLIAAGVIAVPPAQAIETNPA